MPLGMAVGLSPGDFVLDGDPAPPPLKRHSPHFRPMSVVAKRLGGLINATWYGDRPRSRQLCSMGTQLPPERGHTHLHGILAHVCGHRAGWIKMPLGMEPGRKPRPTRRCVRWGSQLPLKGAQPPVFCSCLLWPNG